MMDNATKEEIINRLHKSAGICMTCKRNNCGHGGSTDLPNTLPTDDVLRAINLDEYFFKEDTPDANKERIAALEAECAALREFKVDGERYRMKRRIDMEAKGAEHEDRWNKGYDEAVDYCIKHGTPTKQRASIAARGAVKKEGE
jgi:hypothetical protein